MIYSILFLFILFLSSCDFEDSPISVDNINQDELKELMEKNNFHKCSYRNLSGGIVSIHSGWKI